MPGLRARSKREPASSDESMRTFFLTLVTNLRVAVTFVFSYVQGV